MFSDSHGARQAIYDVCERERPDQLIFLGDCVSDLELAHRALPSLPIICCKGNNDIFSNAPGEIVITLNGRKTLITHGHRFGVKLGLGRLKEEAKSLGASLVLFGHTHLAKIEKDGGIIYVNPGSIRDRKTYLQLIINHAELIIVLKDADGKIKNEERF